MKIIDIKDHEIFGRLCKFEHTDSPIIGINNQHYYDFTNLCDFDMENIDDEVCLGLSTINLIKYPTVSGTIPPKLRENDPYTCFENEVLYNYNGDKDFYREMSQMQRRKYLFFKKEISLPWFFVLDLKPNMFDTRSKDCHPWNENSQKFPYLKSCVEKMPFLEIGRVVIYGSWPGAKVPCHRDEPPKKDFAHHINFNPGGYRPVYLYDSINNDMHYLPKEYKFYAYNTTDYHGVDALPYFSYTIRVDGVYDQSKISILS